MWAVRTSGPTTLEKRSRLTQTSGFFSAKSATPASASTMSRSIGVAGGCRRVMSSVKNAGSSWAVP